MQNATANITEAKQTTVVYGQLNRKKVPELSRTQASVTSYLLRIGRTY